MGKYLVKSGDNLSSISKRLGVSVQDLARNNNIQDVNKIRVGQQLNYKQQSHPERNMGQHREDVNNWARVNPDAVFAETSEAANARQYISPETWEAITSDFIDSQYSQGESRQQYGGGEKLTMTPELKRRYAMIPEQSRSQIFNRLHSNDRDVITKAAVTGVGTAASTPYVMNVVANPVTSAISYGTSYLGGKAVDGAVSATTDYDNWSDMAQKVTGMPTIMANLTNPGTWAGALVPKAAAGVHNLRTRSTAKTNEAIGRYNAASQRQHNAAQAEIKQFNDTYGKPVQAGSRPLQPNAHTRVQIVHSHVNPKGQPTYGGQGRHASRMGGQQQKVQSQWRDYWDDFTPMEKLAVPFEKTAGVVPAFYGNESKPTSSVSVGPIRAEYLPEAQGGEAVQRFWGSPEFQSWYAKQPAGTTQTWDGRQYEIKPGTGDTRRTIYNQDGYQIKGHESVSPSEYGFNWKARTSQTNEDMPVDSLATLYQHLNVPEITK